MTNTHQCLRIACALAALGLLGVQLDAAEPTVPSATTEKSNYEEIDREVQRTWREFCDRLHADDADGALARFSEYARPQFAPTFRTLGTQLHKLSEGWSAIRLQSVLDDYAVYYVTSSFDGKTTSHLITFARSGDGKWYIESL